MISVAILSNKTQLETNPLYKVAIASNRWKVYKFTSLQVVKEKHISNWVFLKLFTKKKEMKVSDFDKIDSENVFFFFSLLPWETSEIWQTPSMIFLQTLKKLFFKTPQQSFLISFNLILKLLLELIEKV